MSEEIKEIPLKERIEKLLESGWVNEFNYLESQLQEARYLVVILQQKVEQLENKIKYAQKIEQEYSALLTENTELENIRKEAIESIERGYVVFCKQDEECLLNFRKNMLNILNKGSDKDV